jgi:lipopolysaccharide cholinephosphotransferase
MPKLNALQDTELGLLRAFAQVAEEKGLRWFVMFGTLLGAARHGGFIPWDDDIDVALPREDYDRLRGSEGWFRPPCWLQTTANDPAAAPRFMRLRMDGTTVMHGFTDGMTGGGHMGAYIDILPLDDVPDGEAARRRQAAAEKMQCQLLASAALDEFSGCSAGMPLEKEALCYEAGGVAGIYQDLAERYERFCGRHSGCLYYAFPVLYGERGSRVYEKSWFAERVWLPFEDMEVPAPAGWKEVLVAAYPGGALVPDMRYRRSKMAEGWTVDMSRPYQDYTRRYLGMLDGIEGKKVYLFGAGDSLRIWMERYSKGLDVTCAFDNAKAKWGERAYGVMVRPPAELPDLIGQDSAGARLIIASIWHEEIAGQLEAMGLHDYYVFVDGFAYTYNRG